MTSLRRLRPLAAALLALWAVLAYATVARATGTLPLPGEYIVDTPGSTVAFNITHFVIASVDGKFTTFSGHVVVGDSLATTHIEATVDVGSIDTGTAARDKHLRSADFFDAVKLPRMTFTSTAIWGTPDNFGIKGNLTIKGVTKEVVFTARILDSGVVLAETKIDRTDFGVTGSGPVKNEVRIQLHIKLAKAAAASPP
jgi:polyisoprenoid-binding protein YceI